MNEIKILKEFPKSNVINEDLSNLHRYIFAIYFTKISSLEEASIKRAIADLCLKELVIKLKSLRLFGFDKIKVGDIKDDSEPIVITYTDDIYDFSINIASNLFGFQKFSTTMRDFLQTCDLFYDFFIDLYIKIVDFIEGIGENIIFIPYQTFHAFEYKIENFKSTSKRDSKTIYNYELMERIIPSLNISESPIGRIGYETRGRTDITINGFLNLNDIKWATWVDIQAPGNKNYSTMELKFSVRNEVIDLPDGTREPFNLASINKWHDVFLGVLKNKIYKGFLQEWLNDVSFESTR